MSLYNTFNGINKEAVLIAPMLGGHPNEIFPRFRDCYLEEREFTLDDGIPFNEPKNNALEEGIYIFTRVGGGNREDYDAEIEKLQAHTDYVRDFDDNFDCTYATFVFRVPQEWRQDYELIKAGELKKTSKKYQDMILATFPTIADKIKQDFF